MRRASIVGPIILIGIGVLFLARNLYPQLPLAEYLAQYWPFVLIAWGVLRLIEVLFWAMSRKPLPLNGVSAGEWALVILVCVIGFGAYEVRHSQWFPNGRMRIGGLEMFGEAFDYSLHPVQKTAPRNARVSIESFRGNARITGGDGDEVKVSGRKTIRALRQEDANSADSVSQLELVVQGDQVIVRTNQDRVGSNPARISEDLEITIPKTASIEGVGRYGDFDITDIGGNVELVSDNAGVRIQNVAGYVRVDTRRSDIVRAVNVKGSVELKGSGTDVELQDVAGPVTVNAKYRGTVQFRGLAKPVRLEGENVEFTAEAVPGQMRMSLSDFTANNLLGPVRLTARSKDVQITDFTQGADVTVDRGDVELRPVKDAVPKMEVHTRSGDIDLSLPEKAQLQLTATTNRGEVTNDYNQSFESRSQGRGATLHSTSTEGPRVNLTTGSGSITVRKASEAVAQAPEVPKVPAPPRAPQSLRPMEQ